MSNFEILGNYEKFLKDSLKETENIGISTVGYEIDHVCFRVSSTREYDLYKRKLLKISSAFLENIVHGRPISKFILKTPLEEEGYSVSLVELPSPKENRQYKTGLEHIEVVVGNDFESFLNRYKNLFSGEENVTTLNHTVFVTLKGGRTIKFHRFPLTKVVRSEGYNFVKL